MFDTVCFFRGNKGCWRRWRRGVAVCASVLALLCAWPVHGETVRQLPAGAKIVVIGGALTEIVYALGAQDQLVGCDATSTYPQAARALADVGYMRALSAEGVLSLAPEGILLVEGSGPPETLDVLKKASVPVVMIADSHNRASVIDKIRDVGHALHREQQARALAAAVEQQFAQIDRLTAHIARKKRVLFVLSLQNGRIVAAGKDTAANAIIELAGGINAINGYSGYKLLNDEAIIAAAPELILAMSNGGAALPSHALLDHAAIRTTPAAKAGAYYQMDGLFLLGFGPRTAAAAKTLAERLYPELKDRGGITQ